MIELPCEHFLLVTLQSINFVHSFIYFKIVDFDACKIHLKRTKIVDLSVIGENKSDHCGKETGAQLIFIYERSGTLSMRIFFSSFFYM